MAEGQKISERELIDALVGNEKIPLGVAGNKAATPAIIRAYLLLTGIDTTMLRDEAIAALETELLGGVAAPGDTLKKLYDLIVALQSSKLDASAYNQHFKGKYPTEAAMNAAYIPAQLEEGDYAQVNEVGSEQVRNFSWDTEDEVWVEGGSGGSGASDTDALPEGATNLYFTSARVLATVITGFVAGAGVVADTDTVLQAINKIVGNIAGKQDTLVSGTNIKTIQGNSLLGAGNITLTQDDIGDGASFKQFSAAEQTKLAAITGTNTGDETVPRLATLLHSATLDTSPQDADEIFSYDVGLGLLLRTTWANVKTFLRTYFDTLFQPINTTTFWQTLPGTPTRSSNTVLTITDTGNANLYDLKFSRGLVLKWDDSGVKQAMIVNAVYAANTVTITIMGDTLTVTATMSSFKWALHKAEKVTLAYAGSLAIGTNVSRKWKADKSYRVFGSDGLHGTPGTTNATTYDINKNGATLFTTKLSIASAASVGNGYTADNGASLVLDDVLSLDIDSVSTTVPVDVYVDVFVFPTNNQFL